MNKACLILLFCAITCIACKSDSKQTGKDVVMDVASRQMSDSLTQDDKSRPDTFLTMENSLDKEKSREKINVSNIRDSISLLLYAMHEKDIENIDIKIEKNLGSRYK